MSDEVSNIIQRVRDLRNHGRYADAAGDLEELIRTLGPDIRLVIELSETLFVQGLFGQVIEVLDEHLVDYDAQENLTAAAGQLIRCFSNFFVTSQFKDSLSYAETVYNCFVSSQQSEVVNDATIRIEIYYCKFRHHVAVCGSASDSHIQNDLLPRLQKAFHVLKQRDDFFNALSVARTYSVCCIGLDNNSLAECLAASDRTPELYRAHAQLLLARAIKPNEHREEQDRLYALARNSFQSENHVHGVLDTEIAMTCRLPLDPNDGTFDERIKNLFGRYEALNYPTGFGDALLQLLDLVYALNDFNTESHVLDELESLFRASKSRLTWLMVRISTLTSWSLRGGDRGKIIQGGEALWNDLIESDCAFFRGQAAQLVSQAYSALKDRDMVAIWLQRAQNDLSQNNLTGIPSLVTDFDLDSFEGLSQCYQMVSALVGPELRDYSPEVALERIEVFLNKTLLRANRDARSWDIIDSAIKLYEENLSLLTDMRIAPEWLAKLRVAQATILILKASSRQDIDLELAAFKPLMEARGLFLKAKRLGNAVTVLQRQALLNVGIAEKFERIHDPQAKLAWQTALNHYKFALDSANGVGLTFLAGDNAYWVAFCQYRQWLHGWCSPEALLKSLLVAESFVDRQRQEVSILRGMTAAIAKGRLSSDEDARKLYRIAIQVCNDAGNVLDAWSWVQKSKARSLSDLLGLGVFIPLELAERIQQDTTCRQLFEDEHRLAEELAAAPDTELFKVRIKLETHQKTMRAQAVLAELLDLREGVPITLDELFARGTKDHTRSRGNQAITFVDWVATESGLSMYVVKQSEKPILRELPITVQMIHIWVSEHLNSGGDAASSTSRKTSLSGVQEEDEIDDGPLRSLDVLVAPLAELSSPDDLLVLCPTGILHALPLHALRVGSVEDRQILIERNPIAYCASLTSFVQCCRRAEMRTTANVSKRLLAVYEPEAGPNNDDRKQFSDDERRQIYASTERLAGNLNGESLCGEKVTIQSFKESLECADLVHFFGHYDYTPEVIAEQSLCIYGKGGVGEGSRPAHVAVKDLFDFRVTASHISLLTCASAVQRFQAGDEPLGLVTAFLSAGATSVLGTLWPVQSPAARLFSEYFYIHLLQSAREEYGVYDLAYATREAILDVKQRWEFRLPYHWASFVLHGAWFFNGDLNSR